MLSNYPPGSDTPDAPWNQPCADDGACAVCNARDGEMEHPTLGWVCESCWPRCEAYHCTKMRRLDSPSDCCVEHTVENLVEDLAEDPTNIKLATLLAYWINQ